MFVAWDYFWIEGDAALCSQCAKAYPLKTTKSSTQPLFYHLNHLRAKHIILGSNNRLKSATDSQNSSPKPAKVQKLMHTLRTPWKNQNVECTRISQRDINGGH